MANLSATIALVPSSLPGTGDLFFRGSLLHRLNRLAAEAGEVSVPGPGQQRTFTSSSCPGTLPVLAHFLGRRCLGVRTLSVDPLGDVFFSEPAEFPGGGLR